VIKLPNLYPLVILYYLYLVYLTMLSAAHHTRRHITG